LGKRIGRDYLHDLNGILKWPLMVLNKSNFAQTLHKKRVSGKFAILFFIISMGCCSCSEEYYSEQSEVQKNQPEPPAPDVYLAGIVGDGIHSKATYWKNGNAVTLTDGSNYAEALSIVVSNEDVFVAGYENNGTYNVAKYWKNGIAVPLTDGKSLAMAYSITLSGNNVYVAGYESKSTVSTAKYWKNGEAVSLTDGTNDAKAYSIVVAGNDVYVAGDEYNGRNYVAKYWKNGQPISLTDGSKDAHAYSIAVSGTEVYVAGSEMVGRNGNGTVFHLTDGSKNARSNSITVSETDVYTAGAEYKDGSFFVAKYWMNGEAVALTDSSNYSVANSIVVDDHDIYLAGKELHGAFKQDSSVALYWKNGSEAPLQNPSQSGGWTNAVFISRNSDQEKDKNSYGKDKNIQREEYYHTITFPNENGSMKTGSRSSGGIFSSIFKHSKNTTKQNTITKNKVPFPRIRLSNPGKHSIVRFSRK
jgi:hypothetical protein